MKTFNLIYDAVSRLQNVNDIILENGWGDYAYLITVMAFLVSIIASIVILVTRDQYSETDCNELKGWLR